MNNGFIDLQNCSQSFLKIVDNLQFFSWNEWLTLPVQFNDLPRTAQLALTIYDCFGSDKLGAVGGTTVSLFSKHGLFRQV